MELQPFLDRAAVVGMPVGGYAGVGYQRTGYRTDELVTELGGEEGGERMVSTLRGNKPGVFGELSRAVSFDSTMMMVEHFLIPFPVLPFDRRV